MLQQLEMNFNDENLATRQRFAKFYNGIKRAPIIEFLYFCYGTNFWSVLL